MYVNEYVIDKIVATRLVELRAESAHRALLRAVAPERAGIRAAIGHALIRAGQLVLGPSRDQVRSLAGSAGG
jgi:hypothetical protein